MEPITLGPHRQVCPSCGSNASTVILPDPMRPGVKSARWWGCTACRIPFRAR